MNAAQHYRGPDEGGTLVNPRIGFGNRRLAILDRAHGQQPMRNADGTVWITYNGEVFNYAALRAELQAQGYQFRTTGDTEVVLHAYEAYGERCVDRLNGQFAFGVWDERLSRLFLARDRLGIAPLHYALTNGRFVFASEAKAIFADPAFTPAIDHEAIAESLLCGTLFGGRTLFRGVETLPPGHWMTVCPPDARWRSTGTFRSSRTCPTTRPSHTTPAGSSRSSKMRCRCGWSGRCRGASCSAAERTPARSRRSRPAWRPNRSRRSRSTFPTGGRARTSMRITPQSWRSISTPGTSSS